MRLCGQVFDDFADLIKRNLQSAAGIHNVIGAGLFFAVRQLAVQDVRKLLLSHARPFKCPGPLYGRWRTDNDDHIDRLSLKYMGEPKYPWATPGQRRVMMRVEPETLSEYL